jgi:hypothetical protein
MATEIIHAIKTDGTGDYTTLTAWEAAQQRDLVDADEIAVAECYSGELSDTILISGWTTDGTRYIHIRPASGAEHGGLASAGLRVSSGTEEIFDIRHDCWLDGIVIIASADVEMVQFQVNAMTMARLSNCVLEGAGGTTNSKSLVLNSTGTLVAWNNIIYGLLSGGNSSGIQLVATGSALYNNTVIGNALGGRGIRTESGSYTLRNNVVQDCGGDNYVFVAPGNVTSSANISEDTTSLDVAFRSISLTFADADGDDYHLDETDTDAIGTGTDLSGLSLFSDDIDGDARPDDAWDIGADQTVEEAEPVTGTGDGTLAAVVGAATGQLVFTGTASGQLAAALGSATGELVIEGTAAGTLAAVTGSASGSLVFSGAGAGQLAVATGSASGVLVIEGTAAGVLAAVIAAATGALPVAGTVSAMLAAVTGAAVGTVTSGLPAPAARTIVVAARPSADNVPARRRVIVVPPRLT